MPEPAPPGELCSGKLGEFSQALRADSIFGSKRRGGMQITLGTKGESSNLIHGCGCGGLPATSSQAEVLVRALAQHGPGFTFSVRSAVGKDMGESPMALWMW